MTREEAIDILNGMFCSLCSLQHPRRSHDENLTKLREIREEALDMAIEALQADPIRCGECENYIDGRCIEANHHVAAHGNCMGVFGAKRREK